VVTPMTCGIYLISSAQANVYYVGQSSDIDVRWRAHRHALRGRSKGRINKLLKRSWDKYGESAFSFSILEECDKEQLTAREQHWIDHFRDLHGSRVANTESPCDSPMRGRTHTAEARMKISIAHTGRRNSANSQRMQKDNPAKRLDVRPKISASVRKVEVINVETGFTWPSIKDCAETLGVSYQYVQAALRAPGRLCCGLTLREFA
jgi:hypothetical protein